MVIRRRADQGMILLTSAAMATCSIPTVAQEAEPEGLQEVTVTATRYEQSLNKVPISVQAFTAEQMQVQGITRVDDVGSFTPGLNFERRASGGGENTSITLRGINTNSGAATTGVYIDDAPVQIRQGNNAFSAQNNYPDIFDLERVEVLRGPQGTLFGEGSMGGTVRFITPAPSLTDYSGFARVENSFLENGDPSWAAGIAGGGPIVDNLIGFRASLYYHHDGGFIDRVNRADLVENIENGPNSAVGPIERNSDWGQYYSFHGALLIKPSDDLTITPSVFYQHDYKNSVSTYWPDFSNPSRRRYIDASPFDEPHNGYQYILALKLNYSLPFASVLFNSSYLRGAEYNQYDQTIEGIAYTPAGPPPGLNAYYLLPNDPDYAYRSTDPDWRSSYSQELRIQSNNDGRLRWTAGAFYNWSQIVAMDFGVASPRDQDLLAQAFGYPNALALFGAGFIDGSSYYPGMQNTTYQIYSKSVDIQLAGYGELNFKLLDRLTLTAGARVSNQKFHGLNLSGGQYAGTTTLSGFSPHEKETPITPKFGVEYQVDDSNMMYATAAKGVRSGGGNPSLGANCTAALQSVGLTSGPESFATDSVWSYEFGAKDRLFNNRLSINTSLYWIQWTGIQQAVYLAEGCNNTVTFNAGTASSYGFDTEIAAKVTDHLTLSGTAGYDDAKFTKDYSSQGAIVVAKGDALPYAVPWQATASANYAFKLRGRDSYIRSDITYRGALLNSPITDPRTVSYQQGAFSDPSFTSVNLRAGITLENGLELSVFGKNLLNRQPAYIALQPVYPIVFLSTERPTSVGVNATYHY